MTSADSADQGADARTLYSWRYPRPPESQKEAS
jgi:hypothetical protein